uniref:Cobyric acid synthase n=1 Tax=uncultured bacterium Contig3b TaxID=1393568 RepID=W0FLQ0_9BACT|nr:cobyric acid synthase CobQ [uncultured bacterium Contig3b]
MAKSIMVQGTMSNAGKSLLAAGLCRVFRQDGRKVAPFKAQNMALNSFITREGLEMGRAQVVQAEAAGVEPSVLMNPILLKPTNDMGSQVIVNGEVWGQMSAREYFAVKRQLLPEVMRAYDALSAQNDVIVIEGAGSPAEINLKNDDVFVNMGMARAAKAPVLLVGDIDRGGVFAQLYGTVALLDEAERAMVKGVVINKFRGDERILTPGLRQLEDLIHIPVVGVVPYVKLDIDDEDSLSERLTNRAAQLIDIAVIRLPRLSNFTDFRALEAVEGVSVRYVDKPAAFEEPDLVILPGTKNTMADLLWLRQSGLEGKVLRFSHAGGPVLGICGGYQMLGEELSDPLGVEQGGTLRGMGLLPVKTVFTEQKTRTRVSGAFGAVGGVLASLSHQPFEGYEIHMGESTGGAPLTGFANELSGEAHPDGCQQGSVYGTYVHGILDHDDVAGAVIRALAEKKGIDPALLGKVSGAEHKERQYNLLAQTLREHMDMKTIYRILEEGIA